MLLALGRPFSWGSWVQMYWGLSQSFSSTTLEIQWQTHNIDRHIDSRDGGDDRLRLFYYGLLSARNVQWPQTQGELGAVFFKLQLPFNQLCQKFSPPPLCLCSWSHNPDVCLGQVLVGFSDLLCLLSINTIPIAMRYGTPVSRGNFFMSFLQECMYLCGACFTFSGYTKHLEGFCLLYLSQSHGGSYKSSWLLWGQSQCLSACTIDISL